MEDFRSIQLDQEMLSHTILKAMYEDESFTNPIREQKALKDIKWMLQFIAEGLIVDNQAIVSNLLVWLKKLFKGLNIEEFHVDLLFEATKTILHQTYHDEHIDSFLEGIDMAHLKERNHLMKHNPYQKQMREYLDALLQSERLKAETIVFDMLDDGVPISDIYLYIFQEVMREVGRLWQIGEIRVGREHYCTAVTQYLMSSLYSKIFTTEPKDKKLLACAVGSELHEMGIRMVADLFELNGWDTNYLGANLPKDEIIEFAKLYQPDVIALSITMPYHLSNLSDTIKEIRKHTELKNVKILVGGWPFVDNESLYQKVGADAFAINAMEGIDIAKKLLQ